MPNLTLRHYEAQKARLRWFGEFLPQHLQDIESLVTSSMRSKFPQIAANQVCYHLQYQVRDITFLPRCCVYGESNAVFFLSATPSIGGCEDHVVLRLPFPDRHKAYVSEVYQQEYATLEYLIKNTKIPVPIPYDIGHSEVLQSPYMVQQTIQGIRLDYTTGSWNDLPDEKCKYLRDQLTAALLELFQLEFSAIGVLGIDGHQDRPLDAAIEFATITDETLARFMPKSQPFTSESSYYQCLMHLRNALWTEREDFGTRWSEPQRTDNIKLEYLLSRKFRQALEDWGSRVSADTESRFKLHHPDLRAGNILVDSHTFEIRGIIDWEGSMVVPISLYRFPTFRSVGYMMDNHDDWWGEYRRDSISLLPTGSIDASGFNYRSYFESMSQTDWLYGDTLQHLDPVFWAEPPLLALLEQLQLPEWTSADQVAIEEKLALTSRGLQEINKAMTEKDKARIWADGPKPKLFLGPTITEDFLTACATALPPSPDGSGI